MYHIVQYMEVKKDILIQAYRVDHSSIKNKKGFVGVNLHLNMKNCSIDVTEQIRHPIVCAVQLFQSTA